MFETIKTDNPNMTPEAEKVAQARFLLTEVMDDPQSVGANLEDESYSKMETENEVRESIDIKRSGVELRLSRSIEHDPERHLPGKFSEALTVFASVPGIATTTLVIVDGRVNAVDYSDPHGSKTGLEGLDDAQEAITITLEELKASS